MEKISMVAFWIGCALMVLVGGIVMLPYEWLCRKFGRSTRTPGYSPVPFTGEASVGLRVTFVAFVVWLVWFSVRNR